MPFQFKKASCVIVGTFNMYIVQPAWLTKIGIFPKDSKVAIWTKFDEPGCRFESPQQNSRWIVTPTKISVETEKSDEDCGAKVAEVLAKLPWTPVIALGNNAIYEAPVEEAERFSDLRNPALPDGFELSQRTFHLGIGHGGQQYNLQLSITKEPLELSVNVHTELVGKETGYAQDTARRFFEQRATAELLISKSLNTSISYGDRNSEPTQGNC